MWAHSGVRWIAGGWLAFTAENLILSENRSEIIAAYGETNYRLVYSTLSTVSMASVIIGYVRGGPGPVVRKPGMLMLTAGTAMQAAGLLLFSQQLPSVVGHRQEREKGTGEIFGMERVTRHPQIWALALTGLGSAVISKRAGTIAFFACPAMFITVGTHHQDSRFRRGIGGQLTPEREKATSNFPFQALVQGRQSWERLAQEIDLPNATLAFLATLALALLRRVRP